MVESAPSGKNPGKGGLSRTVGHLKMQAIPGLKAETVTRIVKERLEPSVELTTDDSTSHVRFDKHVAGHRTVTSGKEAVKAFLPWVHIAIGNAERLLPDVHHKIKDQYLKLYLNEFCYKLNRRYFGERLLTGSSWRLSPIPTILSRKPIDGHYADNSHP